MPQPPYLREDVYALLESERSIVQARVGFDVRVVNTVRRGRIEPGLQHTHVLLDWPLLMTNRAMIILCWNYSELGSL